MHVLLVLRFAAACQWGAADWHLAVRGTLCVQAHARGWPLGPLAALHFAAPAVFDPASQRFFAAVALTGALAAAQLLSWPADLPSEPLERSAERTSLPRPVHSLHPIADAAAREQQGDRDMQVHTAGNDRPAGAAALPSTTGASASEADAAAGRTSDGASSSGRDGHASACVFIVHSDGSVALDTTYAGGRSGAPGGQAPPGRRVAAAAVSRGRLAVVCTDADGSACVALHSAQARCCVLSLSSVLMRAEGVLCRQKRVRLITGWEKVACIFHIRLPGAHGRRLALTGTVPQVASNR